MTNERDLIQVLRTLPVAVCITLRPDGDYAWQCLDCSGTSPTLVAAMSAGLTVLTEKLTNDALVIDNPVATPAGSSLN